MISRLTIRNIALIEKAEINFCAGLNVLSGETGAGKSVILDSVNFVLGAKADKSMIRYGQSECSVCAEFDVQKNDAVKKELAEMEVDFDDELIIARKFTADGRSSIKVNGMPANVAMLRRITAHLVDVHGQSEHFFLLKESNQLKVLDGVAGETLVTLKKELALKIKELKACRDKLDEFGVDEVERNRRLDILSFQIDEIKTAALKEDEEETLILKRNKMNAVEKILSSLHEAEEALNADGVGIDSIRAAKKAVAFVSDFDESYQNICDRLDNLQAEAEDIAETIDSLGDELDFDESEMEAIEKRLDEIKRLKRKYGATVGDINAFLQKSETEYDLYVNSGKEIEILNREIEKNRFEIYSLCRKITALRKAAAKDFTARVIVELKTLNIPSARFETEFLDYTEADVEKATNEGMDGVRFMFSANAGEPVKPLSKIISGGEMSRFMLAIKTQLSSVNGISTYIFDEIDAGISGQTAKVVGEKFAKIALHTQIIAVSHLAQIACMADKEFLIQKDERDGKTETSVIELKDGGRVRELVRLLGGDENSQYAEKHAEELIMGAEKYKNILLQKN